MRKQAGGHLQLSRERADELAGRVREARTQVDLTQESLAAKCGISAEHVSRIERGVGNPSLATLYAVADALGQPLSALLPD